MVFKSGCKKIYYSGYIDCIFGDISEDAMGFLLDLVDEYIKLVDAIDVCE